jgi:hypothetical protein
MTVTWYIDDGYAGGSSPQTLDIDDGDLAECETQEEKVTLIEDAIGQAMSEMPFYWDHDVLEDL